MDNDIYPEHLRNLVMFKLLLDSGLRISELLSLQLNNFDFETRTILPLSLSYDHRIIDGAEAARFNNCLKENLGKNFAYKLAI